MRRGFLTTFHWHSGTCLQAAGAQIQTPDRNDPLNWSKNQTNAEKTDVSEKISDQHGQHSFSGTAFECEVHYNAVAAAIGKSDATQQYIFVWHIFTQKGIQDREMTGVDAAYERERYIFSHQLLHQLPVLISDPSLSRLALLTVLPSE